MSQRGDVTPGRRSLQFPFQQLKDANCTPIPSPFFNIFGQHFSLSSSRYCALKDQKLDPSVAILTRCCHLAAGSTTRCSISTRSNWKFNEIGLILRKINLFITNRKLNPMLYKFIHWIWGAKTVSIVKIPVLFKFHNCFFLKVSIFPNSVIWKRQKRGSRDPLLVAAKVEKVSGAGSGRNDHHLLLIRLAHVIRLVEQAIRLIRHLDHGVGRAHVDLAVLEIIGPYPEGFAANRAHVRLLARVQRRVHLHKQKSNYFQLISQDYFIIF